VPHGVTSQKTPFFTILHSHRRENLKSYAVKTVLPAVMAATELLAILWIKPKPSTIRRRTRLYTYLRHYDPSCEAAGSNPVLIEIFFIISPKDSGRRLNP
jgi:hypothetical protein